jgi:hypothetical protein
MSVVDLILRCDDVMCCVGHSIAGVSRSATVCIAAIMRQTREPFTTVLPRVRGLRPVINPNAGFTRLLLRLSKQWVTERLKAGYGAAGTVSSSSSVSTSAAASASSDSAVVHTKKNKHSAASTPKSKK